MRIGRYEVVRELKGGGMGSVTLCRSPDGSLVVLKRPYSADPDAAVRLRDEARLGARLLHPSIVDTLDFFEDRGLPVLVVAYVDGTSLENLREHGPLPPGAVARIGRQIAEALDALHLAKDERGVPLSILHRDVTPGNIVVDRFGDAKLIDLGIARFADRQAERTQVGFLRGTMRYLAPELIHGDSYSAASDLWSLGLVLWEAALGRHAYPVEGDREILAGILRGEPMELRPGESIEPALYATIAPLLETDPRKRLSRAVEAAFRFAEIEGRLGDTRAQTSEAVQDAVEAKEALEEARRAQELARMNARASEFDVLPPTEAELPAAPAPQSLRVNDPLTEPTADEASLDEASSDAPHMPFAPSSERTELLAPADPRAVASLEEAFVLPATEPEARVLPRRVDNPFASPPAGVSPGPGASRPVNPFASFPGVPAGANPFATRAPAPPVAPPPPKLQPAGPPRAVPAPISFLDEAPVREEDPEEIEEVEEDPTLSLPILRPSGAPAVPALPAEPEVEPLAEVSSDSLEREAAGFEDPERTLFFGDDDEPSLEVAPPSEEAQHTVAIAALPEPDEEPSLEVAPPSEEAQRTLAIAALPEPEPLADALHAEAEAYDAQYAAIVEDVRALLEDPSCPEPSFPELSPVALPEPAPGEAPPPAPEPTHVAPLHTLPSEEVVLVAPSSLVDIVPEPRPRVAPPTPEPPRVSVPEPPREPAAEERVLKLNDLVGLMDDD